MSDPTPPTAPAAPWYKSDWFKMIAGIALGFLMSWLSKQGITPAPMPELPALTQKVDKLEAEFQALKSR